MAIQGLKCDPSEGVGTKTVSISADMNTGRAPRTQTLTWIAIGAGELSREVIQGGMEEFVTFKTEVISIRSEGGTAELRGHSNSPRLTFEVDPRATLEVVIPQVYNVEGNSVSIGEDIPGDPGKTIAYDFNVKITVPSNTSNEEKSARIVVRGASSNVLDSCSIIMDPAPAFIKLSVDQINLNYNGDPVNVTVESNVNWRVI